MAHVSSIAALALLVACTKQQPASAPPPPPPTRVDFEVHVDEQPPNGVEGEPGAPGEPGVAPDHAPRVERQIRDQPPHVKLKLGHYTSGKHGIGVTIDLTTKPESAAEIPPVKLRFDGSSEVLVLDGQHGTHGRIDYYQKRRVILHVFEDGRRTVYVPDPDSGTSSGPLDLRRDGDADPL